MTSSGKRTRNDADESDESSDMFASSSSEDERVQNGAVKGRRLDQHLLDSWDDVDGYYKVMNGELMDEKYSITTTVGKGTFATVVRAVKLPHNSMVAIKMIRNNIAMRQSGLKELEILRKLDNSTGIVRLIDSFEHKGHLCLVFENLNANLRDVVRKYGRDIGINLKAVKVYARQLLVGLRTLKATGYIHADIKPDNILVNDSNTVAKIADLGSATALAEFDQHTPYLASRFYRAPELILGVTAGYALDMWALGCSLFEIYTGKVLFPGKSNNDMLRLIMRNRGKPSHKLLRKGAFTNEHFDNGQLNFSQLKPDRATGRMLMSTVQHVGPFPEDTIKERLRGMETGSDSVLLDQFIDLIDRMLMLNPDRRITPEQALEHDFVK